ncbi:hypothetical protein EKJ_00720 [Qipengyuania flava]|uniref:Uncharacterized protein n=1 Tax=Qipengyuania flava TaxID=192812 RepID=A0A3T1CE23_9SPHN|nr:hypothetical protein [Qipengyuania flava]BBI19225.1 hypothetical protein EKJ_00720 [Qipengyuania flava]
MNFCIGLAGVPNSHFDQVYRARSKFLANDCELIAETLKDKDPEYYAKRHVNFFHKKFHQKISEDHHNKLSDTFFVIFYIDKGRLSDRFSSQFFPSILTVPITWDAEPGSMTIRGRAANDLVVKLREAIIQVRDIADSLRRELKDRDQSTPWLLPLKNFRSKVYQKLLFDVHAGMRADQDIDQILSVASNEFRRHHPSKKIGQRHRRCFVDDRKIEFHPPGNARHAYARANYGSHPRSCLLNGRRRLGFPYDRAFHFDCASGDRKLVAEMASCHGETQRFEGSPHLNVAPNDNVRN